MNEAKYKEKARTILQLTREQSGRTQKEMARLMGVTRQTIVNWECGYSYPTFPDVIKWFYILKLDGTIISSCNNEDVLSSIQKNAEDILNIIEKERKTLND